MGSNPDNRAQSEVNERFALKATVEIQFAWIAEYKFQGRA
jgi:hypothetical protein